MSAFRPTSYAEALQNRAERPRKPRTPLRSPRSIQTRLSADGKRQTVLRRRRTKKRNGPSTKKVQGIFNKMVRERANWKCIRCGRDCSERKGLLHASHFWGVGFTATRFDFDNVDALCYPCHYGQLGTGWEYCKQGDYRTYMIKKLGQPGYDALEQKARTQKKLFDAKLEFLVDYESSKGSCLAR